MGGVGTSGGCQARMTAPRQQGADVRFGSKADMFLGWGLWLSRSSPFGSGLSCDGLGSGEVSVGFDDSVGGLFCGRGATLHLRFKTVAIQFGRAPVLHCCLGG